jgi:coenzyme F420-reducing hydrogenase alpha subunit
MNIQLEKLELIKKVLETNDESIIESIKSIFKKEKKDWWDNLTEEQKFEIEEGERQIERGDFVLYEDLIKKYR